MPKKRGKKKPPKTERKEETKLLTRQEIADAFQVTQRTVTRWESDGCPVAKRAPRGQPSLFNLADVTRWRESIKALEEGDESLSLTEEKAKLAKLQGEKIEMDLAVRRGELLEVEEVKLQSIQLAKEWSAEVRAWPRRAVQEAGVPREFEAALTVLCREMLKRLSTLKLQAKDELKAELMKEFQLTA